MNRSVMIKVLATAILLTVLASVTAPMSVVAASAVWDGSVANGFASGSGTSSDPYIIKTASQLAFLAKSVSDGTTYSGKYVKLANDIILNATGNWKRWDDDEPDHVWTPIGTVVNEIGKEFCGTFDGDNHIVSGVYIFTTKGYQGLFGCIKNATVKNVGVEKSYINAASYVGGVVGYNKSGIMIKCYNTGTVCGFGKNVGGVVGYSSNGTLTNCYNSGNISGYDEDVGGVAGANIAYANGVSTVANCYNTGNVTGEKARVGGVIGYNKVSYDPQTIAMVVNCYNTGMVKGASCTGGIAGQNSSSYGEAIIINCNNSGRIIASEWKCGGITGENDASSYSGKATVAKCYNSGSVTGTSVLGGLVGLNSSASNGHPKVDCCYNTGMVSGSSSYIGGIVGENKDDSGTTYVYVTVENCFNTGNISGASSVGGVVGWNVGSPKAITCYNIGTVSGDSLLVGGIVGEVSDSYGYGKTKAEFCFYLSGCAKGKGKMERSGIGDRSEKANTDVAGSTKGLSAEEMKKKTNFVSFDFSSVWTMKGNADYAYPELIENPMVDFKTNELGDLTGDGNINALDYTLAKAIVLKTIVPTEEQKAAMDVNHDGNLNALDCMLIKAHILKTYVIQ